MADDGSTWKSGLEQALDRFEKEKNNLDETIEGVTRYKEAQDNLLRVLSGVTKEVRQIQITLATCTREEVRHLIITEAELAAMKTDGPIN